MNINDVDIDMIEETALRAKCDDWSVELNHNKVLAWVARDRAHVKEIEDLRNEIDRIDAINGELEDKLNGNHHGADDAGDDNE